MAALPAVAQVAEEFKRDIARRDVEQGREFANRMRGVVAALETDLGEVANDLARRREDGRPVTHAHLYQLERHQALLYEARREWAPFAAYAESSIEGRQLREGAAGLEYGIEAIRAVHAEQAAGRVPLTFARLPAEAVREIVAQVQDKAPLGQLLQGAFPVSADAMAQALVVGIARGANPRDVARAAARRFSDVGLSRALTIARTEQLRAYRNATLSQYREAGVVEGYARIAAKDSRTCIACLVADGTQYPLNAVMPEHPMGRCAMVPLVTGMRPVTWETGQEWFAQQDADTQQAILGPGRYRAWSEGKFALADVARVVGNRTWGDSLSPMALRDLLAGEKGTGATHGLASARAAAAAAEAERQRTPRKSRR